MLQAKEFTFRDGICINPEILYSFKIPTEKTGYTAISLCYDGEHWSFGAKSFERFLAPRKGGKFKAREEAIKMAVCTIKQWFIDLLEFHSEELIQRHQHQFDLWVMNRNQYNLFES